MAQLVKIITEETIEKERQEKRIKAKATVSVSCPICGSDSRVYVKKNFLDKYGYIRRYRECRACGNRFVTIQNYSEEIIVEKQHHDRKN